jgi:ABC-2 type transport system ATP-binding protein
MLAAITPSVTPADAPSRNGTPAVRARELTRRYDQTLAVDGLTLQVRQGTILGLIGPSGSGKTTTIRLLTGIEVPDAGEVEVLGRSPATFGVADRARLGYMPQLPVLFPNLSLQENLRFVASIYGMPLARRRALRHVLDLVELTPHRRKRLRDASGGMQRRLALAAALVHDPDLMFLDEPTAGIDPVLRRRFWDHFAELRADGRTLLVTTQYVGEAANCDEVAVIDHGRVVALDTPDGLRRQAFGGDVLDMGTVDPLDAEEAADLGGLAFVTRVEGSGRRHQVVVDSADRAIPRLHEWLSARGHAVKSLQQDVPSFDDVFVALVGDGR